MLCQGCLQVGQGHARIHGDREVIHCVINDPAQLAHAQHRPRICGEWRAPVQTATQAGGDPGPSFGMQVGNELAKLLNRIGC